MRETPCASTQLQGNLSSVVSVYLAQCNEKRQGHLPLVKDALPFLKTGIH